MPPLRIRRIEPIFVGIDPGARGGIAAISKTREIKVLVPLASLTLFQMWEHIRDIPKLGPCQGVLERLTGFIPGSFEFDATEGGGSPGAHMFTMGASFGALRAFLVAEEIPYSEVMPRIWQKGLGIEPKQKHTHTEPHEIKRGKRAGQTVERKRGGESTNQFKARLRGIAEQMFSGVRVTSAVADALLIAEFCRLQHSGPLISSGSLRHSLFYPGNRR